MQSAYRFSEFFYLLEIFWPYATGAVEYENEIHSCVWRTIVCKQIYIYAK